MANDDARFDDINDDNSLVQSDMQIHVTNMLSGAQAHTVSFSQGDTLRDLIHKGQARGGLKDYGTTAKYTNPEGEPIHLDSPLNHGEVIEISKAVEAGII